MRVWFLIFALWGCYTTGKDFPSSTDWIQIGTTNQEQVHMILGEPFAVGRSNHVVTWTYANFRYGIGQEGAYKELKFFWNSNGTVQSYHFNSSFAEDKPKTPRKNGHSHMRRY